MATPNPENGQIESPFSPEQLAQFVTVEEPTAEVEPKPPTLTAEEIQQITAQSNAELQREVDYLKAQVSANRPIPLQQTPTIPTSKPSQVQIQLNPEDGMPVLNMDQLNTLIEQKSNEKLQQYHEKIITPEIDALMPTRLNNAIDLAVMGIRRRQPDLLEKGDPKEIGQRAIDLMNSQFNPGRTELERVDYTLQELNKLYAEKAPTAATLELPISTGQARTLPAANQVGRTAPVQGPQPNSPYPWGKGATVKIKAQSLNDLGGIQEAANHAAYVEGIHRYNQVNSMGWKIVHE